MQKPQVLIVGAGPTGLVLAMSLARQGVPLRIIDENPGPGEHSRAMAVHARTLEFYAQFGIASDVIAEGISSDTIHLRERDRSGKSREVLKVSFDTLGEGLSPYPFVLTYPQDLHERLLVRKLEQLGISVERDTRLTGFTQDEATVTATIAGRTNTEATAFDYVCGCDGARSVIRRQLGVGFGGGTYEQPFYVADVRIAEAFDEDIYMNLGQHILALMMPVRMSGMHRLIGLVPPALADKPDLTFDDIRLDVEELVGIRVAEVNWFSRYRVHHRVADRFRVGRAFLLGDAGHIHSPVGGQGMNTGIGDAINLGWKLAHALRNGGGAILDSYEPERIAFGRSLVATTDRVFAPMVAGGVKGELVRRVVAPMVGIAASSFGFTRRAAFRTVSQIRIDYDDSPLSEGRAGGLQGGDRLPWVDDGESDNFAPLTSLDWQIHVYGEASPEMTACARRLGLPIHAFAWTAKAREAGIARDTACLVRPDGYIGLALAVSDDAALQAYAERIGLAARRPSGS